METAKIASDGDELILAGKSSKVKLLVSSSVLISASKVFAALLGPHFREGQNLGTSANPKEIELPDDDATGTSDVCHLLHNKQVKDFIVAPTPDRIFAFAVVVDKYDCVDALKLQIQAILLGLPMIRNDLGFKLCAKNLLASYLLQHAWVFKQLCARAIFESTTPFASLQDEAWAQQFPPNLIYALENKRSAVQQRIVFELPTTGISGCSQKCAHQGDHTSVLIKALKVPFWPPPFPPRGSYTLLKALDTVKSLGKVNYTRTCGHGPRQGTEFEVASKVFVKFADDLKEDCLKICLACIKAGKMDFTDECKIVGHKAEYKMMAGKW